MRIARHEDAPEAGPRVVLVQGLAKGDKMETVIRHATELGVAGFVPLACRRSILKLDAKRASSKVERWRTIAQHAVRADGRARSGGRRLVIRRMRVALPGHGGACLLGGGAGDRDALIRALLCPGGVRVR